MSYKHKSSPRESDSVGGCPCSFKGLTLLVILDEESADHNYYIKSVLPVALKYRHAVFGDKWTFQHGSPNLRRDHLTQE